MRSDKCRDEKLWESLTDSGGGVIGCPLIEIGGDFVGWGKGKFLWHFLGSLFFCCAGSEGY